MLHRVYIASLQAHQNPCEVATATLGGNRTAKKAVALQWPCHTSVCMSGDSKVQLLPLPVMSVMLCHPIGMAVPARSACVIFESFEHSSTEEAFPQYRSETR